MDERASRQAVTNFPQRSGYHLPRSCSTSIKWTTRTVTWSPSPLTTFKVSMAPNLTSGEFRIVSLIEGNPPVGVNRTKPASQDVHLNGPVRTVWQFLISVQNAMLTSSAVVGSEGRRPQHLSTQYRRISLHRDRRQQSHCFHPCWAKCRMARHLPAPSGRIHVRAFAVIPCSAKPFSVQHRTS